ncbi:Hypothetical predicted protein [Octopus vulgaris]|uniref:Uncharacterized protein n=1 Tax=Octopus vulgaris TaxID=6645 RepID=A0AA36FAB8_OCTVU|nr:Hypothetical predicted protein [Octopus vulgaris]
MILLVILLTLLVLFFVVVVVVVVDLVVFAAHRKSMPESVPDMQCEQAFQCSALLGADTVSEFSQAHQMKYVKYGGGGGVGIGDGGGAGAGGTG